MARSKRLRISDWSSSDSLEDMAVRVPGNETIEGGIRLKAPIRPIRKLKVEMMPTSIKKHYQLHWRPIFSLLEEAPGLTIREAGIDAEYISLSFQTVQEYLKQRVSYVFNNERTNPDVWAISTWSKKVARSSILKFGTENDKANLPAERSHRNRPRQQRGRRKGLSDERRRRVHRRDPPVPVELMAEIVGVPVEEMAAETAEEGGGLPDIRFELSDAARARGEEIEASVAAEVAADVEEARRVRRIGVPDGDGGTIHIMHRRHG